jgi:hypothetical protein
MQQEAQQLSHQRHRTNQASGFTPLNAHHGSFLSDRREEHAAHHVEDDGTAAETPRSAGDTRQSKTEVDAGRLHERLRRLSTNEGVKNSTTGTTAGSRVAEYENQLLSPAPPAVSFGPSGPNNKSSGESDQIQLTDCPNGQLSVPSGQYGPAV